MATKAKVPAPANWGDQPASNPTPDGAEIVKVPVPDGDKNREVEVLTKPDQAEPNPLVDRIAALEAKHAKMEANHGKLLAFLEKFGIKYEQ